MEGVSKIFGGIVDVVDLNIRKTLSSLDEHQTLWDEPQHEIEAYFAKLTALLGSAETRDRGLILLSHFVPQCPYEILEERMQYWIHVCAKICNQKGQTASIPLACDVLTQLVLKSVGSADLSKLLIGNISKIMDSITTSVDPSNHASTLEFLGTIMLKYPGPSGPSKNRIEQYLYSLIDSEDPIVVDRTGSCLLLLQQIKGGGQHGNLHKKTWEEYQCNLVDTIHDLLSKIFAHTPESFDVEENLECLKLPKMIVDDEPVISAQRIATRLLNLISFLEKAILEPYPVAKPVRPMKILNVIFRGHAVSCRAMARNSIQDNLALGLFLPNIQKKLLEVLDALVSVLKANLLLFGNLITDLFDQCLKTTLTAESKGRKKSFVALRIKVYESIGLWCETVNFASGVQDIADGLLDHIIQDVTPYEPEVTLQVNASRQKLSSKARKKLQKQQNAATSLAKAHSSDLDNSKLLHGDCGNEVLCLAALNCLSKVLEAAGCFIKPALHKILQEKVVSICFSVFTQVDIETRLNLYCLPSCRAALLGSLNALIVNPHHHCPPPLQYGISVFQLAKNQDPNNEVRIKASELVRCCELLIHPRKEVFYFPTEENAVKDMLAAKKKHPLNAKVLTTSMEVNDQTSITFEEVKPRDDEQSDDEESVESIEQEPIARVEEVTLNNEKTSPIIYELCDDENAGELQKSVVDKASESQAIRIDSDESEIEVVTPTKNDVSRVEKNKGTKKAATNGEEVTLIVDDDDDDDDDDEPVVCSSSAVASPTKNAVETPMSRKRELSQAKEPASAEKRPKVAECDEDVDARVNDLVAEFVDELNDD